MVTSVTNYGRSGVYDWIAQRFSAVVLASYTFFLLGYLLMNPDLNFAQWSGLFESTYMRIFSLLAIFSLGAHAWIGLWTIATDYIKPTVSRFIFQTVCGITIFAYIVWGIQILWGL